ncbi:MAG: ATP-binding cassette domain-containing protein [Candidatus Methylacidiphilales bacterium]|nr:ATP-binding cassette domain-containing protein [Candidatus Methylacidiphilales bacterium]
MGSPTPQSLSSALAGFTAGGDEHLLEMAGVRLTVRGFELKLDFASSAGVLGIFGPSGAGKTSLLEVLTGLRIPQRGRIVMRGQTLFDSQAGIRLPARARRIGYVPQDGALFPHLSVRDNLLFGARARAGFGLGAESQSHRAHDPLQEEILLMEITQILEIDKLLKRSIPGLSGGEQQRVAIGRALLSGPRVLLLDEPLASLDDATKSRALGLLRRVRDHFGVPIVYVSHDREEMRNFVEEVLVLRAGEVVNRGRPADVLRRSLRDLASGTGIRPGTVSGTGISSGASSVSSSVPDPSPGS